MFRTAGLATLLAIAAFGCSSSDGGGVDGDLPPEPGELVEIDGPAVVERNEAEAELDD